MPLYPLPVVRAAGLVLLTVAALAACRLEVAPEPSVLRVSAIPDQSPERVWRQHGKVVELVCAMAHVRCEWTPAASYEELVERVGRGEIDLAYFGGVAFARARRQHAVDPLVMRDVDTRFTSVVVVRREAAARSLDELRGLRFAFGNRSSTSGHVMARHLLRQAGIEPERDFASVVFSGGHDATLRMVARGEVDAGVVNGSLGYRAIASNDPELRDLRALWQSPPYTDYVWAVRRNFPENLRQRLLDAFLDLDHATAERRNALELQGASGFVPAYAVDFAELIGLVEKLDSP